MAIGVAGTRDAPLPVAKPLHQTARIANDPNIGIGNRSLGRGVLGTFPVEADGSVHFELPPGLPVYFQALDAQGRALQTMRSVTYAHPGERLFCQGCHESRHTVASTPISRQSALALQRPPSPLVADIAGSPWTPRTGIA